MRTNRIQYCDGVKETIIYEDQKYRFLITTHEQSTEGKHVFFKRNLTNPLSSGWKYFQTEQEAFDFGNEFVTIFTEEQDENNN